VREHADGPEGAGLSPSRGWVGRVLEAHVGGGVDVREEGILGWFPETEPLPDGDWVSALGRGVLCAV
jgi:hypothetical protein